MCDVDREIKTGLAVLVVFSSDSESVVRALAWSEVKVRTSVLLLRGQILGS
jgi:hypothetical protein